jgi:hypothetical protein
MWNMEHEFETMEEKQKAVRYIEDKLGLDYEITYIEDIGCLHTKGVIVVFDIEDNEIDEFIKYMKGIN